MTETQQETTPEKAPESAPADKKKSSPVDVFCRKSGYEPDDVLDYNLQSRTFVTTNGGKYQITAKGDVRTLSGPVTPKQAED